MSDYAIALPQLRVSGAFMTARPTTSGHGADLASWPPLRPVAFTCFVDGDGAMTITGPGGAGTGPEVWTYRTDRAGWSLIGQLGKDDPIAVIAAGQGYAESLQFIGAFDRIAIVGTPSAGNATAQVEPVETRS